MKRTRFPHSFQTSTALQTTLRETLQIQMRTSILQMVKQLFDDEVNKLCGEKYAHKKDLCHRGGSDDGSVLVQGQRIHVKKPRIRRNNKEVHLDSYQALQGFDVLSDKIMTHMMHGVSTRNYAPLVDEFQNGLKLKKSAVSEAFKMSSQKLLDKMNMRSLQNHCFVSVMIDGIEFSNQVIVCALGITEQGKKMLIGLREGSTENAEVCIDLLQALISRGLNKDNPMVFVIDGSKALRKAIKNVFGTEVPVQRCIRHKERNITSYLPDKYHAEFYRRWKLLHGCINYTEALTEYRKLSHWLGQINHEAVNSLEEAETDTLTLLKLNCPRLLRKTLMSTNPIESAFSKVRDKTYRVKNWKTGKNQISRWAASTLFEAEKKFRTIKGYAKIPQLIDQIKKSKLEKKLKVA